MLRSETINLPFKHKKLQNEVVQEQNASARGGCVIFTSG